MPPEDETWKHTGTPDQVYTEAIARGLSPDDATRLYETRYDEILVAQKQGTTAPAAGGGAVGAGGGAVAPEMVSLVAATYGVPEELLQSAWDEAQTASLYSQGPTLNYSTLIGVAEDLGKRLGTGGGGGGGGVSAASAYNAQRQFWLDQIEAGLATVQQAENAFTRWVNEQGVKLGAQQEAGRRGADILATLEQRARTTMPEETVSGLNEMIGAVTGRLGLPGVKLPAMPAESYPNPYEVYKQAGVGLEPGAAPEVPFFPYPVSPSPGAAGVATGDGGLPSSGSAGIDAVLQRLMQQVKSAGQALPRW